MCSPYTPSQNGTAERWWRTAFDMVRCVLLESGLPKSLWTYALRNSDYNRNRCYQKRTGSTPYELFLGKRPNLKNMVAFGTPCYVLVENTNKLDDRSEPGYFVGHDRESPAYLIYDKRYGSVKRSRNVVFDNMSMLHDGNIIVPDNKDDLIVHNNNDVDIVQDKETEHIRNNDDINQRINDDDNQEINDNDNQVINDDNDPDVNDDEPLDRPRREVHVPRYLAHNYVLGFKDTDNMDIDYCYKMCMNQVHESDIPDSYEEAIASLHASEWQAAMKKELVSLCNNDTWDVVELLKGERVVGTKWVYIVKLDHLNNVTKYKARYVAKGYAQRWGIDYYQIFAPTARLCNKSIITEMCTK